MKATIFYDGEYSDRVSFEAETIEEIREIAFSEVKKRGWNFEDCYSEVEEG